MSGTGFIADVDLYNPVNNQPRNHQKITLPPPTIRTHRGGFVRFIVLGVVASLLCPALSFGQTNTVRQPSNRFLLLIETSRGMQRRSEGALRSVQALILTGLGGQAHRGDTIGVWTYNEELYAGLLPLQTWVPEGMRGMGGKIINFLNEQKFEKNARLEKVLPTMFKVIQNSEFITVILINDGSQKLEGTPFDRQINEAYKSWRTEQQEAHMPFITILRAKKGKITDYTVNPAQWPLDMPPLPEELATNAVAKAASPPSPTKSTVYAPSLYLIGNKASTNPPAPFEASQVKKTTDSTSAPVPPSSTASPSTTTPEPGSAPSTTLPPVTTAAPQSAPVPRVEVPSAASAAQSDPAPSPTSLSQDSSPKPAVDVVAAAPSAQPVSSTVDTAAAAAPAKPEPAPLASASVNDSTTASPSPAVALPATTGAGLRVAFILGTVLALGAGAWLLLKSMRRARAVSHASLITRSLDRTRKE